MASPLLRYESLMGGLIFLLSASVAQAIVVNFDTAPDGTPIANGTDIANTYASIGVTFAREGGTGCGPSVYANADDPPGFGSPPNVVSTCGGTTASDINGPAFGRIRASFSHAATSVCIDVLPDGGTLNAVLSVYDVNDALITQSASTPGATETICASAADIRYARFPGTGNTDVEFARFDNLIVTFAPPPSSTITPVVGLWWNPSESGSGYNIDVKHGVLVMTFYSYKPTGAQEWYITSGPIVNGGFTGTLDRYVGGQCISCAYGGLPTSAGNAGVVTINFTSPISATMLLPGGRVTNIQPEAF
jgi:hypothetical protein